jgi:hypothetical protein
MIRTILAVIVIAVTASPSKAERVPVTCDQFVASINEGGKTYDAPPLTIGEALEYGDFKDSKLKMFPSVYIGLRYETIMIPSTGKFVCYYRVSTPALPWLQ